MKAQELEWSIQLHAPAALIQDKYSRCTLNTRWVGIPVRLDAFKKLEPFSSCQESNHVSSVVQSVV